MENYNLIRRPIGSGSFGTVYLATHVATGRCRVLKAVRLAGMTAREKSDVTAEVKVLSQLEHQNIVEYIESFQVQRIEYVCVSARCVRSTTTLCNNPLELHELASAARQPGNGITQLRTSLFEPQLAGFSAETRVAEAFLFLFRLTTVEYSVFLVDIDAENVLLFQDILHRYGVLRRR